MTHGCILSSCFRMQRRGPIALLRLSGYQVAECKCANGKSTGAAPGLQPKMFTFTQVIGFDRNLVQSTPIAMIYSQSSVN